jgi:hypothetical protein
VDSGIESESLRLLRGIAETAAKNMGVANIYRAGAELGLSVEQVDALQAPLHAQGLIQTELDCRLVFLTALGQFRLEPE